MHITWHAFDLRTGRRGPRLHTRQMGSVSRIIGEATETALDVLIWDADTGASRPGWQSGTMPGRSTLVALDENDEPVWEGMVYRRIGNASESVQVQLVTLEAYLDRRFVSNAAYTFTEQAFIAKGLIDSVATDGVSFTVVAAATGVYRDREYFDDEDKTVLSVLQELAGVDKGIEFTAVPVWTDDTHTRLRRELRIASRIGHAAAEPNALFKMPGSIVDFSYVEDYSADNGANAVTATSSGEGESRPESQQHIVRGALDNGWVRFDRRFSPSTSITDVTTLNAHARAEVLQTWNGLTELTLEANLDAAPQLGKEWDLGDDVGVVLTCPRFPARRNADEALVPGYQGVVRAVGYEVDYDARRIRPRLLEAQPVDVETL